jgi:hypothetical protein
VHYLPGGTIDQIKSGAIKITNHAYPVKSDTHYI